MNRDVRIAIFSDIHGNLPALDAVLADLERDPPDQLICLGDVGAMGPFPEESLDRVRELGCPVIMGNGDAAMLDPPSGPAEDDETGKKFSEMDHWAASRLSDEHRAFIQTFRATIRVNLPGERTLLCFHGSPRSHDDIISATTPDQDLDGMFEEHSATVMAGGHWHFQMLRRFRDMILFNPGSVGLPYEFDSDGEVFIPRRAEYGVLTVGSNNLRLEHRRVDYDSSQTIRAMQEREFPHAEWWAQKWR